MLTSHDLDSGSPAGRPAHRPAHPAQPAAARRPGRPGPADRPALRHVAGMTRRGNSQLHQPSPRPRRPRQRHPVQRRRDHPDPRHQQGPAPDRQQPVRRLTDRGLRRRARHSRPGRSPLRHHRSHRDTLSTTRDSPSTTQPRRTPSGGVFHSQDIPTISVADILMINVAQHPPSLLNPPAMPVPGNSGSPSGRRGPATASSRTRFVCSASKPNRSRNRSGRNTAGVSSAVTPSMRRGTSRFSSGPAMCSI